MFHVQKVFINNLRYYRNQSKLTQSQFAENLNLSTNYYNAIENGKNFPSLEVIEKICKVSNLLPYQLFLEIPTSNISNNKVNIYSLKKEIINLLNNYI